MCEMVAIQDEFLMAFPSDQMNRARFVLADV